MDSQSVDMLARVIADALRKTGDVPVGVSARHIHLSQEHIKILFGAHQLEKKRELMGGQFVCNETVTIVGPRSSIEKVRVLGPARKQTQVEISATDCVKLGTNAPLRDSGVIAGSAPVTVAGPKGAVYLNEGCIIAARHIHMPPNEAARLGLKDGSTVSVAVENARGLTFNNVKIRVDETFTLEMHIDTDEANASGLKTGDRVKIVRG